MGTGKEVKERRKNVKLLRLSGIHIDDIAKKMGVTERTINNDIAAIRKELAKSLRTRLGQNKLMETLGVYDEEQRQRIQRLWSIITDNDSKKRDVLKAVQLLQQEEELRVKRDQIGGLLPQDKPLVAIQNNRYEKINIHPAFEEFLQIVDDHESKGRVKRKEAKAGPDDGAQDS